MHFLFDNPLANMSGPLFLALYGTLIGSSALAFYLFKSRFDWTSTQPIPLIPSSPDPFEIAYLRGGENELARSVIFSLFQKGFLDISNLDKKYSVVIAKVQPNWTMLAPIERSALTWFQSPRDTADVFRANGLTEVLRPFSNTFEEKMSRESLLMPTEIKSKTRILSLLTFAAVFALGFYKFVAAIVHGRSNVLLLIGLTVIALVTFIVLGKAKRLSARGSAYLENFQNAFARLKENPIAAGSNAPVLNGIDPLLLTMGVFGATALVGNGYDDFENAFHRASANSSGSCGTSCGSSCSSGGGDGGGSCGSGCGGCGGGD